jgi:uncharacterized protein YegL
MAENDFSVESPQNYEQKCLCVLVLDVSGSMSGPPIEELNQGLKDFREQVQADSTAANRLEISILTFSSFVDCLAEPTLVETLTIPTLAAKGSTKMVDAVREAIVKVEKRKEWYRQTGQPYYRPWIILITDGEPDMDQDVEGLAQEIRLATSDDKVNGRKFIFFAVGVQGAKKEILEKISNPQMPPAKLQGLKFKEFFRWLSASMTTITSSKEGGCKGLKYKIF